MAFENGNPKKFDSHAKSLNDRQPFPSPPRESDWKTVVTLRTKSARRKELYVALTKILRKISDRCAVLHSCQNGATTSFRDFSVTTVSI